MKNTLVNLQIFLIAVFLFVQLSCQEEAKVQNSEQKKINGSIYSKEGRSEYFFNRLKDPKTGAIPAGIRNKELAFVKSLNTISANKNTQGQWQKRGPENHDVVEE